MAKPSHLTPLPSRWYDTVDRNCPLNDYPRPQLRRDNWQCLNGTWQYAIRAGTALAEPETYDGDILVPFSPEALLSGVDRQLLPGQTLWYRREFQFEQPPAGSRLLLHFGAVDQRCAVFVNGAEAGRHEGGYWPFHFDITDLLQSGPTSITLAVWDDSDTDLQAYGKQKLRRGGIWYTAQSGIWQTVWTEVVPSQHIRCLAMTPDCEHSAVEFDLTFAQPGPPLTRITIRAGDTVVAEGHTEGERCVLPLPGFRAWSPDDPFLYTVRLTAGDDTVESYVGMRQFGIEPDDRGQPRFTLNGQPLFQSGLLDQGYWSDGLYTAPCDEAMRSEIAALKDLGFTMVRKHIKIEPLRWYYHCDRLGMLVWQDFVSGGGPYNPLVTAYLPFIGWHRDDSGDDRGWGFGRTDQAGRAIFGRDMHRTVDLLYNCPAVAVWVPFNEGWGQFEAARIAHAVRVLDGTRLIDHASGWHDQGGGDFASHHVYFKRFRLRPDRCGRIQALTEFGGYSCPTPGHMASDQLFGYRMYPEPQSLTQAVIGLYDREIIPQVPAGLTAAIYTQVSDVEDEINGLFTYDRAELKLDAGAVRRVNAALRAASASVWEPDQQSAATPRRVS